MMGLASIAIERLPVLRRRRRMKEIRAIFDSDYYLRRNPDVAEAGIDPFAHYLSVGWTEGRDPSPLFDNEFYLRHSPDVAAAGIDPLTHFVISGAREGRQPHPLFDPAWYLEQNSDVAAAGKNPLAHYLERGAEEPRQPHPLFDAAFYLEQNPDVAAARTNPLLHFIGQGWREGRNPNPLFDTAWYLQKYPDVAAGVNSPADYLSHGHAEVRDPNQEFDAERYAKEHPKVAEEGVPPPVDCLRTGGEPRVAAIRNQRPQGLGRTAESLVPEVRRKIEHTLLFDPDFYRQRYAGRIMRPDDLLLDYIESSSSEIRDTSEIFSGDAYLAAHPDVRRSGYPPLLHYALYGIRQHRLLFDAEHTAKLFNSITADDVLNLPKLSDILTPGQAYSILFAQNGNFFFAEIANYLAFFLGEAGYSVSLGKHIANSRQIVVAPHEYFLLEAVQDPESLAKDAIHLNTEQWQTTWFSRAYPYLLSSQSGVIDINPTSAVALNKLGIRAAFLPLFRYKGSPLEHPASAPPKTQHRDILPLPLSDAFADRPYDVFYFAVLNERRGHALARLADTLSDLSCFVHTPAANKPLLEGGPDTLSATEALHLCGGSKILLNIHRDEVGYLEWHRFVLYGIAKGCVVLTEQCTPNPHLVAGVHFLQSPLEAMPAMLRHLLKTDSGARKLQEIHRNTREFSQTFPSPRDWMARHP